MAEEVAAALAATDKDVEIGGAGLAATAITLGLVDQLHMFRHPVVVGGGTPFLPPVTEDVPLVLIETRTFGLRDLRAPQTCQVSVSNCKPLETWRAVRSRHRDEAGHSTRS